MSSKTGGKSYRIITIQDEEWVRTRVIKLTETSNNTKANSGNRNNQKPREAK